MSDVEQARAESIVKLIDELVARGHHFELRWIPERTCGCSDPEYCERVGGRHGASFVVAVSMKQSGQWRRTEKLADPVAALFEGIRIHDEEYGQPSWVTG